MGFPLTKNGGGGNILHEIVSGRRHMQRRRVLWIARRNLLISSPPRAAAVAEVMHPDAEFRLKLFMKMKNFRGPTPNRIQRKIENFQKFKLLYSDDRWSSDSVF